jgi:hypothetical protein
MANVISGRQILINTTGVIPLGNFKVSDGKWEGATGTGNIFSMVDAAGRVLSYTSFQADYPVDIGKLGWLSGPVTINRIDSGNVILVLDK